MVKELVKTNHLFDSLGNLWQDVRLSCRRLIKDYTFTIVVISIIAVTIGANTVVFSLVNAVLLKSPPYPSADQLVMLWQDDLRKNEHQGLVSFANYEDWRTRNHVFQSMAAFPGWTYKSQRGVDDAENADQPKGAYVTTDFFRVMGIQPAIGRGFSAADESEHNNVVVISHGLWQRRFGADPQAIGKSMLHRNDKYSVIGVMPRGFEFPGEAEFWTPTSSN